MNPTDSEVTLRRSPLHDVQARGVVAFGDVDGWEMPLVYDNIKMEYLAAKGTVAVIDRSHQGRLRITGAKRLDLLHRLTTNDLKTIGSGQGCQTAMLSDKGRILDDLRLYAREDHLWLITSPEAADRIRLHIEKLRFRDDVTLEDATGTTAMIALLGPQSVHLLEAAAHVKGLADLQLHHSADLSAGGTRFIAAKRADIGGAGFNLIVEASGAAALWGELLSHGGPYGAVACAEEAHEMLRIETGLPREGRELTEDHNPLEARLDAAISWTKGCYIGQEVVARLDSRQKVSKLLVGAWLEPGPVPAVPCPLVIPGSSGTPVGTLTSVAPSLDFRRVIGLGYVRTDLATPGSRLEALSDGDRILAEISDLPFRAPSQSNSKSGA